MKIRIQAFLRDSKLATLATLTLAFTGALGAQDMRAPRLAHPSRVKPSVSSGPGIQIQRTAPSVAPAALNDTTWTNIGPAPVSANPTVEATPDSGRINGIAPDPNDANTVYVAASGGGVWKTVNGGTNWIPLTDTQQTLAMGAIAMAPSNSQVLYAGTGEPNGGGNFGRGVLVSINGGTTWTLQNNNGLFDRLEVSEIAIDPTNAKVAYVATSSCCGTNTDSSKNDAVWKTADGGVTWTNATATIDVNNGVSSVRIDLGTPSTLYVAAGFPFGAAGNGVYKSTNSGATWNRLTGAPSGTATGVIKVAVSKSNPKVVYVAATGSGKSGSTNSALYRFMRSDDGGATFTNLTAGTPNYMSAQGNFDTTLIVDPANSAIVYAAGDSGTNSVLRSTDSGAHWTDIHGTSSNGANGAHVDHHSSAFDKNGKFLDGDDGGIFRYDPAATPKPTWTSLNGNLSTILFQGLGISPNDPKLAVGGTQDNGGVRYSGSLDWAEVTCGDGGKVRFSQQDPSRVYIQCPSAGSFFLRSDDGGVNWNEKVKGITDDTDAQNFYAPFAVDPNDGNRVIYGARHAFETTNAGETWAQLGTFTFPANIDALDISASHPDTIYASAGGKTFVTTDRGVIWTKRDLPVAGTVSDIKVFRGHNLSAVAVINNFTTGGNVFHTTDGGKTWIDITGNLPAITDGTLPVWTVQFHGNSIHTIYVGNDDGVYKTTDKGATWFRFGAGLPNAQVFDLQLDTQLGILAAGTFGRGAWEIKLPPPTTTTVSAVEGKPGDLVTLKADVKPAGVPGVVKFLVNGVQIPGTATYDSATGRAEQPYTIPTTLAVGKHVITADFMSSNEVIGGNSGGVNELTVK